MGVEYTCRSGNRGGVSLFYALTSLYLGQTSITLQPIPCLSSGQKASERGKMGQKLDFICLFLSNLGILRDRKRQNINIFLKYGCRLWGKEVQNVRALAARLSLVTGAGGRAAF